MYIRFELDRQQSELETGHSNASEIETTEREFVVTSSSLKLARHRSPIRHRTRATAQHRQKLRVNVYQVLPDAVADSPVVGATRRRRIRKRLIDSRLIDDVTGVLAGRPSRRRRRPAFEEFDVLKSVREWTADPSTNLGLLVVVEVEPHSNSNSSTATSTAAVTPRTVRVVDLFEPPSVARRTSPSRTTGQSSSLFLETKLNSGPILNVLGRRRRRTSSRSGSTDGRRQRQRSRRSRSRRSPSHGDVDGGGDCRPGDGETRCCRHPLWVSFREIGWDQWIIAPEGYMAYYCDGSCPPQHRVASRHAGIQALVNGVRSEAAPTPCCAPSRMSSLPIAHFNSDGRQVVSVFDNMIVDECMCT